MAVRWTPARPGNWLFHCHFAFHIVGRAVPLGAAGTAEAPGGSMAHRMAGLVLGIHVRPRRGTAPSAWQQRLGRAGRADAAPAAGAAGARAGRLRASHGIRAAGGRPRAGAGLDRRSPADAGAGARAAGAHHRGEPARRADGGALARHRAGELPRRRARAGAGPTRRLLRAIAPGDSFTAEFTPPRAGTFIYHSHANELIQISGGLYGPLIVVEPGDDARHRDATGW